MKLQNIYLIKDIFSVKEVKKIFKLSKPLVEKIPGCPGLQSYPILQDKKQFNFVIQKLLEVFDKQKYKVSAAWINFTSGDYINWHNHPPTKYSVVYFLKNKDSLGTMFKVKDEIIKTTMKENSAILFPSKYIHSCPISDSKINRWSIVLDLIENENN
mgnify:FL=1